MRGLRSSAPPARSRIATRRSHDRQRAWPSTTEASRAVPGGGSTYSVAAPVEACDRAGNQGPHDGRLTEAALMVTLERDRNRSRSGNTSLLISIMPAQRLWWSASAEAIARVSKERWRPPRNTGGHLRRAVRHHAAQRQPAWTKPPVEWQGCDSARCRSGRLPGTPGQCETATGHRGVGCRKAGPHDEVAVAQPPVETRKMFQSTPHPQVGGRLHKRSASGAPANSMTISDRDRAGG